MNYRLLYNLLVQKAQTRKEVPDVIEKHHILPKSMGGSNSKSNIVFFTPKEHYVAHHLLWKVYRNKEMHYAFWLMVNKTSNDGRRTYRVNSRTYSLAKEQHSIEVSRTHTGRLVTAETRKRSSMSLKGKPAWNKGLKNPYSEETLEKMSVSAKNKNPDTAETRKKKSESAKRRHMPVNIHSEEARAKRKLSNEKWRNENQAECPHCDKIGISFNMRRYHFENCKFKEKENLY